MKTFYLFFFFIIILSCTKDDGVLTDDEVLMCTPSLMYFPFCETPAETFISSSNFPATLKSEASDYFNRLTSVVGFASKFCNSPDTLIYAFEYSPDIEIDTIQIFNSCDEHYAVMTRVDVESDFKDPVESVIGIDLDGYIDFLWEITDRDNNKVYNGVLVDNSRSLCGEEFCYFLFDFESSSFCDVCVQ